MAHNKTKTALKVLATSASFFFAITLIANPIIASNYKTITGFLGQSDAIYIQGEEDEQ